MLIYNTTFHVSDKAYNSWLKWVKDDHTPFMLDSGYFSKPQVARIVTGSKDEGFSFSVQFQVNDMKTLKLWHQEYSTRFQENCARNFGTEVLFFTTVLELIE